ncbi:MAG: hypothetical protein ABIO02_05010 [Patescibacteria group bacterium]
MGFRIPTLYDILVFAFTIVVPTLCVIALLIKYYLEKTKHKVALFPHKLNVTASLIPISFIALLYFIPAVFSVISSGFESILGILVLLLILLLMWIPVFLYLELTTLIPVNKKSFLNVIIAISVIILFAIIARKILVKSYYRDKPPRCDQESCRKTPKDCIQNHLGDGTPCISVDSAELG